MHTLFEEPYLAGSDVRPGGRVVLIVALVLLMGGAQGTVAQSADSTKPAPLASADALYASEAGTFSHRYVGPDTYGGHKQNWDAAQDSSGILYVGNTEGILSYDGREWRRVPTANRSIARSVVADEEGRIFVGAQRDFGVLRRDSTGRLQHVSLLDHVPQAHRSFTDVWRTETTSDGVYFVTSRRIFRWQPEARTMDSWAPPREEFGQGGTARDSLFINAYGRGLMTVAGDSLQLVPGGETFSDREVIFVRSHPRHGVVVGTYSGLFVRDGNAFRRFATEVDALLNDAWTQRGRVLADGSIAIATVDKGLLLLGPEGSLRRRLTPRNVPVIGLHEDREGGLWALLDGGMVRYDLGAPYTRYDAAEGLEGSVHDVVRHQGTLYAATNHSTHRLRVPSDTAASFVSDPDFLTQSWTLLSIGDDLFVGTATGLRWRSSGEEMQQLFEGNHVYDLLQSRHDSTRIYAATGRGVRRVEEEGGEWVVHDRISGVDTEARVLAEGADGALWVGTSFDGVYRAQFVGADSTVVDHFGTKDGLPPDRVDPVWWQGRVVIGTSTGVLDFVPAPEPHFEPIDALRLPDTERDEGITRPQRDAQGRLWGITGWGAGRWARHDSTWRWAPGPLRRLRGEVPNVLHLEQEGRVHWIGTQKGLVRYVPGAETRKEPPPARIREVVPLGADSVLTADATAAPIASFPFEKSSIRIAYSSPTFARPGIVEYQYRLSSQDDEWSAWTGRTTRELPDLGTGTHAFTVRGRTAYGEVTRPARYAFVIAPPWYRTWWAYGLYGVLGLALVGGAVQWRTQRLRRRQEQLEQTVAERTEEVREQRNQLEQQAERLRELDEAKSRFFANISHEFRTPLTLIRGPVTEVRDQLAEGRLEATSMAAGEAADQLDIARRNAERLQRLIDQILGLARLEAGTYDLAARPLAFGSAVERIVSRFAPLADQQGLSLHATVAPAPDDVAPVYVDSEALENILGNLLSNAIKFTPEGGTVDVQVREGETDVEVAVRDTGPGIPDDQQEAIFERFARAERAIAGDQEGAGIGLAFAHDLVELHGGTIDVESAEGDGTTVTVRLPRGRDHLSDDHVDHGAESSSPAAPEESDARSPAPLKRSSEDQRTTAAPVDSSSADVHGTKRVLIVDDNADVRQYVASILASEYDVLEAADGAEGLRAAREQLPDIILADVMMPNVDGHAMTRALKDDPETEAIPVIMLTARAETSDEVTGLRLGADDYVTKPFDADVLRQRVGGVLTLQQRLRRRLQEEFQEAGEEPSEGEDRGAVETSARDVIRDHITEVDFKVEDLADALAMSRSTLYRKLKEEADITPSTLLRRVRLEKARTLLREGESATQVAYAVGYTSLSSFSQTFKKEVGVTPSAYAAEAN